MAWSVPRGWSLTSYCRKGRQIHVTVVVGRLAGREALCNATATTTTTALSLSLSLKDTYSLLLHFPFWSCFLVVIVPHLLGTSLHPLLDQRKGYILQVFYYIPLLSFTFLTSQFLLMLCSLSYAFLCTLTLNGIYIYIYI